MACAALAVTLGAGIGAAPAAEAPVRLLVLGDSLSSGWGLAAGESFPARLEAALRQAGHHVRVLNAGVAGDTTAGGRARLDWSLADKPDAAIIELGANDGLRGIDPAVTDANLDAILSRLAARDVAVLLTGMVAPPNLGTVYGDAFKAVFPRLARRHGVAFYPFFLDGVAGRAELNQHDGVHPNRRGVAILVDRIMPHVVRLLATLP
jgi:acyl-CoA thioesterase-1